MVVCVNVVTTITSRFRDRFSSGFEVHFVELYLLLIFPAGASRVIVSSFWPCTVLSEAKSLYFVTLP